MQDCEHSSKLRGLGTHSMHAPEQTSHNVVSAIPRFNKHGVNCV